MGFLKKIFGGGESRRQNSGDSDGFLVYVQCDNCDDKIRLRVHKQHELNRTDVGYVWHKTIIDNRCFQPIHTVVHFDTSYQMASSEIEGGHFISREAYEESEVSGITEENESEL
jgi:hypothetical protein